MMDPHITVRRGDITRETSDAIVNAANSSLLGGGGVDGAIHRAGGPKILRACEHLRHTRFPRGLPTGEAVATPAGELPARYVIHTVGPIHHEHPPDGGADLLAACHTNSLEVADQLDVQSISFPAISCGVYGWSVGKAAPIAMRAVRDWLSRHPDSTLKQVRFVVFNESAYEAFAAAVDE